MTVAASTIEAIIERIDYATEEERESIQLALDTELVQSSPAGFAQVVSRKEWTQTRHHDLIDAAVMETLHGESEPILIIETPPRHGKSTYISQHLTAWYLGMFPKHQVILSSATDKLADIWGRKARSLLTRFGPKYFDVSVSEERHSASDWDTNYGGGMRTAGIGGDIMGRDGNLLIVDDYLKNPVQAQSESIRDNHWEWWQSTFLSRLEPGGFIIVICTRWHKDDLIGRVLTKAEEGGGIPVRRIRLPAIAESGDILGRQEGEALWPARWPLGKPDALVENDWGERVMGLRMRQKELEPYLWKALFQQEPTQHGRAEFPAEYFPDRIWIEPEDWPEQFDASAIAIDPSKGKSQKKGDYSAIVFVGLTDYGSGPKYYVACSIARRPPDRIVTDGVVAYERFNPDVFGVESNMNQDLLGPMFDQHCKDTNRPPIPITMFDHRTHVRTDKGNIKTTQVPKELRIVRLGPYLSNDRLRFVKSSGCRLLVDQLKEFSLGDHDDGPDGLEMAIRLLNSFMKERREYEDDIFEVAVA